MLSDADVIFVNGLQLEEPTKELAETNKKDGAEIVEIGDEVLPERRLHLRLLVPEGGRQAQPAPVDRPAYAIKYAEVIARTFSERDPAQRRATTRQNQDAFTEQADALSRRAAQADQKTVPTANLKLLTYHDAYAYFAKTYGWDVIGAVQPKNFEDPSPQEVARIIDQVKAREASRPSSAPRSSPRRCSRRSAARPAPATRTPFATTTCPGEPGDAEHSWLGLMRYDYINDDRGRSAERRPSLDKVDVGDVATDDAEYPQ